MRSSLPTPDDESDAFVPESGILPLCFPPARPFALVEAGGSATSPSASLVISLSKSLNFRASASCFSASSSFLASPSLESSSLESPSPSAPSEDDPDPARDDDAGESGRRAGDRVRLGPWSVIVEDDETFFVGRGNCAVPGCAALRGLWTCSAPAPLGIRACVAARPCACACPSELSRARTPMWGRRVLMPDVEAIPSLPVGEHGELTGAFAFPDEGWVSGGRAGSGFVMVARWGKYSPRVGPLARVGEGAEAKAETAVRRPGDRFAGPFRPWRPRRSSS